MKMNSNLQTPIDKSSLICLCPVCLNRFFNVGKYRILRADYCQDSKDTCTYCQTRMGYDYYVTRKQNAVSPIRG